MNNEPSIDKFRWIFAKENEDGTPNFLFCKIGSEFIFSGIEQESYPDCVSELPFSLYCMDCFEVLSTFLERAGK